LAELRFETMIQRPIEDVFNLIADLPHYGQWLPPSSLYGSVTQYSALPVGRGTQYVDQGKVTRMTGRVTAFEAPKHITFQQSTVSMLGALEVEIRYTLESVSDGTRVIREVHVHPGGAFGLIQGRLLKSIRQESERILASMKAWLDRKD
jgi:uncharacterized protein YndB with AHSA1/START domain